MSDLSSLNPVGRFEGLAELYDRHRPSYPTAAIDFIAERCQLGPQALLVDIGCGTGIASRLFAVRGIPVLGIEPNDDMRRRAESVPTPDGASLRFQSATAEAPGLPAGAAAAVLAAQAFHWFDAARALVEFHRILQPAGHVALMWNERDESDPFTAAYGAVVRSSPEAAIVETPRATAGQALMNSPLFENASLTEFGNAQTMDEEGLLGRAFSVSYAPREPRAAADFAESLRNIFRAQQKSGKVVMRYRTSVYLAEKR